MPEAEPAVRTAAITKQDLDSHGGTDRCPGCRALKSGKYRAKHTDACRKRFAELQDDPALQKRFAAAHERKMDAITRKAMEAEGEQPQAAAPATSPSAGGAASPAATS